MFLTGKSRVNSFERGRITNGKKLDSLLTKVEGIESLTSRRLMEDRAKNQLIEEVKADLAYRRDLETGLVCEALFKELLHVADRLYEQEPSREFNESVLRELVNILKVRGLTCIDINGKLNPSYHEVVGTISTANKEEEFDIIDVKQLGFLLGGKVLRPAKVFVYKYSEEEG